ncbi:MAG TPA: polymer-forming cytoskeletal protein [Candidatus Binatia bacterium]|nr:polymer-forming cytoskeletal protein [Candidatus Binatia bacterium]
MSEPLSTERTFFSAGTRIEGTLELDGEVKLEGQIKGKVSGTGIVIVGEQANLEADVFAPSIVVHGVVRGEVHATERLELHRTARVKGLIRAPRIRIDEGATFEGECRMTSKEGAGKVEPLKEEKRSTPLTLTPPAHGGAATKTVAQS